MGIEVSNDSICTTRVRNCMKELYTAEYYMPNIKNYKGFIYCAAGEKIQDAAESYFDGKYSKSIEEARASTDTHNCSFYYVEVTYFDDKIIKIVGEKYE